MHRIRQSIIFAFFWSSVSLPSQQAGQQTLPKNERTAEETCPDTRGWTGKYTNHSYGFAITIPSHLQGFWNSARCVSGPDGCTCMSDHGRIIPRCGGSEVMTRK